MRRIALALPFALVLAACASSPPPRLADAPPPRTDLAPFEAVELEAYPADDVLWGGMIIEVRNRPDASEIEVLAHPLDRKFRPIVKAPTEGRFIARVEGYLEPFDYPQGRFVTIRGKLTARREALIDEKLYLYPVLDAREIDLLPQGFQHRGPRFSFGFGIGVVR